MTRSSCCVSCTPAVSSGWSPGGPYLYTNLDASEPDEQAVIDAARSRRPASVLRKA
jgi:hypothetical protein